MCWLRRLTAPPSSSNSKALLERQLASSAEQLTRSQALLADAQAGAQSLSEQLADSHLRVAGLEVQLQDLALAAGELKAANESLAVLKGELAKARAARESEKEALSTQIKALRTQAETETQLHASAMQELHACRAQLGHLMSEAEASRQEVEAVRLASLAAGQDVQDLTGVVSASLSLSHRHAGTQMEARMKHDLAADSLNLRLLLLPRGLLRPSPSCSLIPCIQPHAIVLLLSLHQTNCGSAHRPRHACSKIWRAPARSSLQRVKSAMSGRQQMPK